MDCPARYQTYPCWEGNRFKSGLSVEDTADSCDVRSVVRVVKSNALLQAECDENPLTLFDPTDQWSYSVSDDPLSPAIIGVLGGLKLKQKMEVGGCDESVVRTCLLVQSSVQQATEAASACLFFYHEKTNELRTFVAPSRQASEAIGRNRTSNPESPGLGGGNILSPIELPRPNALLEVPPARARIASLMEPRRKLSAPPSVGWNTGLLYHFNAQRSIPGKVFQALQGMSKDGGYSSNGSIRQPLSPWLWVNLPPSPRIRGVLTNTRGATNSLLSEVLGSRSASGTTKDRCLFILIRASPADGGGRALGLLALRDPLIKVPLTAQPAMIRYLAHIETGMMSMHDFNDRDLDIYAPKDASEAACLCLCQGMCLWLDLSLRNSLRTDAFKAEILKREFLLSLTQYVCKDSMDVNKMIDRFEKVLTASFASTVCVAFVVDDVSREFVRVRGGTDNDPVALPFSHCVLRRCLSKAEPLVSFIGWRSFWRSRADHDETHDTRSLNEPLDCLELWLEAQEDYFTPSPNSARKTLSKAVSVFTTTKSVANRSPPVSKKNSKFPIFSSNRRMQDGRKEGPKIFLPLRTADGLTKLLLVIVRRTSPPVGTYRVSSSIESDSRQNDLEKALASRPLKLNRLSTLKITGETTVRELGFAPEGLNFSSPTSPSDAALNPLALMEWQLDKTFSRELLEVLRDTSDLLSVELGSSLSRYVLKSLMLLSNRRRESAPSHSILEFVFGPSAGVSGSTLSLPQMGGSRRASAPFVYNLYNNKLRGSLDGRCDRLFLRTSEPDSASFESPSTSTSAIDKNLDLIYASTDSSPAQSAPLTSLTSKRGSAPAPIIRLPVPSLPETRVMKLASKLQGLTSNLFPASRQDTPTELVQKYNEEDRMYRMFARWEIDWWYLPQSELSHFFEWSLTRSLGLDSSLPFVSESIIQRGAFFNFIANSYRASNPYHNFYHAAQVYHATWLMLFLHKMDVYFHPIELYSLLISALCHDVDHPGVTNQFLIAIEDTLAIRYNDMSVLEHHHAAFTFHAMRTSIERDITYCMDRKTRLLFRQLLIEFILATDMQKHSKLLSSFTAMLNRKQDEKEDETSEEEDNNIKWKDETERKLLGQMLLHGADLSNPIAPFPYFHRWASLCIEEFNNQVDREIALGIDITGYMNCRSEKSRIEMELGFCEFVVLPLWRPLAQFQSSLDLWLKQGERNSMFWRLSLQKSETSAVAVKKGPQSSLEDVDEVSGHWLEEQETSDDGPGGEGSDDSLISGELVSSNVNIMGGNDASIFYDSEKATGSAINSGFVLSQNDTISAKTSSIPSCVPRRRDSSIPDFAALDSPVVSPPTSVVENDSSLSDSSSDLDDGPIKENWRAAQKFLESWQGEKSSLFEFTRTKY
eukprot:Gregarina_sp_Poly_1__6815@NODE_368_length_9159_cov_50_005939_g304_i0_p1_GENE_NODE_368_length_9159_cov_50_005939_g304_i0NODE_368_length_9159_cov_50_005939_g304_i0_p1_ORF_typecomplete_len1383_score183_74PDEase_I/PF00233_19/3_3e70NUC130_3NT/PF08158_12/0_72_NODE_368_length_9159_cov_50_005939_g304_i010875235